VRSVPCLSLLRRAWKADRRFEDLLARRHRTRAPVGFAAVGLILTATAGLIVWIVLWALGAKGFDAFLLSAAIILLGASLKILAGYLPGRRS
jgi:hypothetical protein